MRDEIVGVGQKVADFRAQGRRNVKGFRKAYKAYAASKRPVSPKEGTKLGFEVYNQLGKGLRAGAEAYGRTGKSIGKSISREMAAGGKDMRQTQGQARKKIAKAYGKWFIAKNPIFSKGIRKDTRDKRKAMFKAAFAQHEVTREEVINALVETLTSE